MQKLFQIKFFFVTVIASAMLMLMFMVNTPVVRALDNDYWERVRERQERYEQQKAEQELERKQREAERKQEQRMQELEDRQRKMERKQE